MRFVTSKDETDLAELTRRIFGIKEPRTSEQFKQAETEILRVNPHLRDLAKVPAGTLIVVPDVVALDPATPQTATSAGPEIVALLREALDGVRAVLDRSVEQEEQNAESMVELAKDRELAKQAPELTNRLARMADRAKANLKKIQASTSAHKEGLAQLQKDLEELIR